MSRVNTIRSEIALFLAEVQLKQSGPERLRAAVSSSILAPGKRVRSVLLVLTGEALGGPRRAAVEAAGAVEMIHAASLILDDLPSMDDARTRRGAACIHVTHGESIATLAALAVINRGYAMIWQGIHHAPTDRRAEAGRWVDARLGPGGVIGGQAYDLSGWRGEQSVADVSEVAARKTGDLLRLTLVLPALVGRGTKRELQILDRLALLRGLAYQAADDLKDVVHSGDLSGKTAGRDEELGRPSLVAAEGYKAALQRLGRLVSTGDRVQTALPGPADRWTMLGLLRVSDGGFEMADEMPARSAAI